MFKLLLLRPRTARLVSVGLRALGVWHRCSFFAALQREPREITWKFSILRPKSCHRAQQMRKEKSPAGRQGVLDPLVPFLLPFLCGTAKKWHLCFYRTRAKRCVRLWEKLLKIQFYHHTPLAMTQKHNAAFGETTNKIMLRKKVKKVKNIF